MSEKLPPSSYEARAAVEFHRPVSVLEPPVQFRLQDRHLLKNSLAFSRPCSGGYHRRIESTAFDDDFKLGGKIKYITALEMPLL
jgi:hypothetical protein